MDSAHAEPINKGVKERRMRHILVLAILSISSSLEADIIIQNLIDSITLDEQESYSFEISPFYENESHISIRFDPRSFSECTIEFASLQLLDEHNEMIAVADLRSREGRYIIQVSKSSLPSSRVIFVCEMEEDGFTQNFYEFNLRELSSSYTNSSIGPLGPSGQVAPPPGY